MQYKPPPLRTVAIHSLDKKGKGVGLTTTQGRLVVPHTIPGEEALVQKLRGKEGRVQQILTPSPYRTNPLCVHFGVCGGCAWQHIDYAQQLRFKQQRAAELFAQRGVPLPQAEIPITPSEPFYYRNRMDFVWWHDGRLGLRRSGKWHTMEDLRECHLSPPATMPLLLELKRRALEAELPRFDQKLQCRGLRYFMLRFGLFTGEIMLCVVSDPLQLSPSLWAGLDGIVSVYQLINDNLENQVSDGEPVHLDGAPYYREKILGRVFHVGPRSFFQPNPAVAISMVEHARELIAGQPHRRLLDLYCGVGLFSVLLADRFDEVLGIELSPEAVDLARLNAAGTSARFECAPAESVDFSQWSRFDTLLLDPPRFGLMLPVLKAVLEQPFQQIVYVSCNPDAAIRDIAALHAQYDLQSVRLFDQFPQTPHMEMIAYLRRRER